MITILKSFVRWQLLLFASFIIIVLATDKSGLISKSRKNISLVEGNILTGEVTLDPSGIVPVKNNQKVRWSIDSKSKNIDAFYIKKKDASDEIFNASEMPPDVYTRDNDRARVRGNARDGQLYEYAIYWKEKNGTLHQHDPKIAVNPSAAYYFTPMALAIVYGLSVLILSGIFYQKFKKEAVKNIG